MMIQIYRQCQDDCRDESGWHYYQMKIDVLEEELAEVTYGY